MERKLVITKINENIISSIYEDGKMVTANVSLDSKNNGNVGDIYVARVENVVKNINAAFVEISKGEKCYYSLSENTAPIFLNRKCNDKVNNGDLILVQIERDAVKTKMAVATSNINIGGRYVAVNLEGKISVSSKIEDEEKRECLKNSLKSLVTENIGFVIRTAAAVADIENVVVEATRLKDLLENILAYAKHRVAFTCMYKKENEYPGLLGDISLESLNEIVTDDKEINDCLVSYLTKENNVFKDKVRFYEDKLLSLNKLYRVETSLKDALKKRVWLKSGGYLVIEPTEALIVIDVNTGKYDGKKGSREETFLKVNLEAAKEIAFQLRLRNYSGIIIIDFIDMADRENNNLLMETLKECLKKDSVKTSVVGITKLGLVEMTRKKVTKPLYEQLKGVVETNEIQNSDI